MITLLDFLLLLPEGSLTAVSTIYLLGYVEAAVIPKGARSITVSESKPCTSFLGKRQHSGISVTKCNYFFK